MVRKILPPVLADDKKLRVGMLVQKPLRLAQHVLVIHTGQTLVCGDDEIGIGSAEGMIVAGIEIPALHALDRAEDALDLAAQRVKIGPRPVEFRASFPQLGGRDQIHRVRDLLRVTHALDAVFDLLCAAHLRSPSGFSCCAMKRFAASRICAQSPSVSWPVVSIRLQRAESCCSNAASSFCAVLRTCAGGTGKKT